MKRKRQHLEDYQLKVEEEEEEEEYDENEGMMFGAEKEFANGFTLPDPFLSITKYEWKGEEDEAEQFFAKYVAKRIPVIITLKTEKAKSSFACMNWSYEELLQLVPDHVVVQAEKRKDCSHSFGTAAPKVPITFHKLIKELQQGELYYMTTQDIPPNQQGLPSKLWGEPIGYLVNQMQQQSQLAPLLPSIAGNLIPQQLNLWLGSSRHGTSSGLHHDFHDNLYVLIKGKKRFRISSPEYAQFWYQEGELASVHPNGIINYRGYITRDDGANIAMPQVADEMKVAAEVKLEQAEQQLASLKANDKATEKELSAAENAVQQAEEEMDELLDALLDAEEEEKATERPAHFSKVQLPSSKDASSTAFSFLLPDEQRDLFPQFNMAKFVSFTLNAGELLYLPAGWAHEVTSYSNNSSSNTEGHIAFNYWFHPPNTTTYQKPYKSDFWLKWKNEILSKDKK